MVGDGKKSDRSPNDFYETPASATHALLDNEIFDGGIWEPACGAGAICNVLTERGYCDVSASDLINRGYGESGHDFIKDTEIIAPDANRRLLRRNVITNPPFNLSLEFTRRALEVATGKVAMFNKLTFIAGINRYEKIFKLGRLRRVYVFCKRPPFCRPGEKEMSGMMEFAWFVFDKTADPKQEPVIKWIDD